LIDNRYDASLYNAFATAIQTLAENFTEIIIYCCAFLGGIFAIEAGSITEMTPINAVYVFGMALELPGGHHDASELFRRDFRRQQRTGFGFPPGRRRHQSGRILSKAISLAI
jgi:Ca2+/H+ antiporter